jgi:hypothetical protein
MSQYKKTKLVNLIQKIFRNAVVIYLITSLLKQKKLAASHPFLLALLRQLIFK